MHCLIHVETGKLARLGQKRLRQGAGIGNRLIKVDRCEMHALSFPQAKEFGEARITDATGRDLSDEAGERLEINVALGGFIRQLIEGAFD